MIKKSLSPIINYINLFSALGIIGAFMFDEFSLIRTVLYVFFTSYIIEIFADKKYKDFKWDKTRLFFVCLISFFLLAFIYMPFEHFNQFRYTLIERRLSLLGFGIVGLFGTNSLFKFKYFLYAFIITSVVAISVVFYHLNIFEFIHRADRSDLFTNARISYVNNHMKFNFYLNISLISIWYLIKKHWSTISVWKVAFIVPTLTLIMYVLSITEGRSGFIAGIFLMLSFVFIELFNRWKVIGVVSVLLFPILFVLLVSNQRRMTDEKVKHEPRLFLWQSGINVIKEKPIFGYGISDAQVAYKTQRIKYQEKELADYFNQYKLVDSHDQYIQTTMEAGIPGLILLIFLYIFPIFISDKRRLFFTIFVVVLCLFQSVFDIFLTGTFSLLFGMLMIMILRTKSEPGFVLVEPFENKLIP
jgi:O-antigen ligase